MALDAWALQAAQLSPTPCYQQNLLSAAVEVEVEEVKQVCRLFHHLRDHREKNEVRQILSAVKVTWLEVLEVIFTLILTLHQNLKGTKQRDRNQKNLLRCRQILRTWVSSESFLLKLRMLKIYFQEHKSFGA